MPMIRSDSGCKVGWETYDNEAEARARGAAVQERRRAMEAQGYDWGYQCPGEVVQGREYPMGADGRRDYKAKPRMLDEWTVTVP